MKSISKWVVSAGAILLFVGFFLPNSGAISAAGFSNSLFQLANKPFWLFLYLEPLFAIIVFILALVPAYEKRTKNIFLVVQIGGLTVTLILFLVSLLVVLQQDPAWKISNLLPGLGFLFIILGAVAITIGVFLDSPLAMKKGEENKEVDKDVQPIPSPIEQVKTSASVPYLEYKKGSVLGEKVLIQVDNFSIGRGRDNHLQIKDRTNKVSRVHAKIRYSEEAWYIQDQKSNLGTYVNGKRINATRLKTGDTIKIGEEEFEFHLN